MTTVSQALHQAADRIERHGLWQGGSHSADGLETCASNAIYYQYSRDTSDSYPARCAFADYLGLPNTDAIFAWNDAPERTAAEVIETLRAAAIIAAAQEAGPLTATDLHALAATYSGTVTESPGGTRLVGATMAGTSVDLGPVRAVSV